MSARRYTVACLTGHGIGPELMGEASRALAAVSRLHGFVVDDVHVPFGREAQLRSGQHLPLTTRNAYLSADAVLVADGRDPALRTVEGELDARATLTQIQCAPLGDLTLVTPLGEGADAWTVERAFALARSRRGRLTSVNADGDWEQLVDAVGAHHDGILVEHLSVAVGLPALAFERERFDVVVTGPLFADSLTEVAASSVTGPAVVASGRLAGHGPGLFAPVLRDGNEIAGQGVANPCSMLLATALALGEGLGQRSAAETLVRAVAEALVRGRLTPDLVPIGMGATTRDFTDRVLRLLPESMTNREFSREALAW